MKVQTTTGASLIALQPEGSMPITYLIHGMAGHLLRFNTLIRYMAPDFPLYGLQAKGLNGEGEPLQTVEDMASVYIQEIKDHQPEGPYYIGGFSFGGYVAFEMARQFNAQGQQVALLVILDTPASTVPRYSESLNPAQLMSYQVRSLAERSKLKVLRNSRTLGRVRNKLRGDRRSPRNRSDPSLDTNATQMPLAYLGQLTQPEGESKMGEDESASPYQYMMDLNLSALIKYAFHPYPGKITLFKAKRSWRGVIFGWESLAGDGVEIHQIPGTHLKILEEPNVKVLADKLKSCILRSIEA